MPFLALFHITTMKSTLILALLPCAFCVATEIEAPKSIQGASIRFQDELFYPGDIAIEQYEAIGNTARVRLWLESFFTPVYRNEHNITGERMAKAADKKAKAAVITFTEKNGRVLTGKISGFDFCYSEYKGRLETETFDLPDEKIEIILPQDDEQTHHTAQGPEELPSGTIIQIETDKRTITGELGKQIDYSFLYFPREGEKAARLGLFFFPKVGNQNTFYTVSLSNEEYDEGSCIIQGKLQMPSIPTPIPYIYFTEKVSDKIYKGVFFGFLHGYSYEKNARNFPSWKHQFCEQLHRITLVLP